MTDTDKLATDRAELCDLLQQALMLELSTIPPYATACYSILEQGQYDRSEPVIVNAEPIEVIRQVMVEEMLHMVLVANVLNAIGGAPKVNDASQLPTYPCALLGGKGPTVRLRRFSPEQVKSFREVERAPDCPVCAEHGDYHTIGGFYLYIRKRLEEACAEHGAEAIFIAEKALQISNDDYYGAGGHVIEIKGSPEKRHARALKAIREIMEEGEGAALGGRAGDHDPIPGPEHREDIAHYFKFNEILHSRYYQPDDRIGEPPSGGDLIVDWSAVSPMRDDPKAGDYADMPEIRALSEQFDAAWSDLLDELNAAFNGEKHRLRAAIPLMYRIKDQAQRLMRVPLPGGSGETAGPTWTYRRKRP